jgi:exopolysaccharide biosynthesis protein|tara:strand:+ start:780 stop:1049 length:270 start_codon:yes stop_codon:yes gene_type:complete
MGWIKLSSIFFIIVFVIFLTLGGREFFEYFDVGITKKNASENANVTETKENQVTETKEIQVIDKHENNKDQEDKIQEKEQKDDEWSEFN